MPVIHMHTVFCMQLPTGRSCTFLFMSCSVMKVEAGGGSCSSSCTCWGGCSGSFTGPAHRSSCQVCPCLPLPQVTNSKVLCSDAAGSRQLDTPNQMSKHSSYPILHSCGYTAPNMLTPGSQPSTGLLMRFIACLVCMSCKRWALQAVAAEGAAADAQAQAGPEAEGCTGHRPALAGPPPLHHGLYPCLLRQPCNLPICLRHAALLYSNKRCSSC